MHIAMAHLAIGRWIHRIASGLDITDTLGRTSRIKRLGFALSDRSEPGRPAHPWHHRRPAGGGRLHQGVQVGPIQLRAQARAGGRRDEGLLFGWLEVGVGAGGVVSYIDDLADLGD